MKTNVVPDSACPHCGYPFDRATDPVGRDHPSEGDFGICISCAGVNIYTATLAQRKPTRAELEQFMSNPECVRALAVVRVLQGERNES